MNITDMHSGLIVLVAVIVILPTLALVAARHKRKVIEAELTRLAINGFGGFYYREEEPDIYLFGRHNKGRIEVLASYKAIQDQDDTMWEHTEPEEGIVNGFARLKDVAPTFARLDANTQQIMLSSRQRDKQAA